MPLTRSTHIWPIVRPSCVQVDGPATYLNIASRHEHIQNRRSMGIGYLDTIISNLVPRVINPRNVN
jgi:hypothetical protein